MTCGDVFCKQAENRGKMKVICTFVLGVHGSGIQAAGASWASWDRGKDVPREGDLADRPRIRFSNEASCARKVLKRGQRVRPLLCKLVLDAWMLKERKYARTALQMSKVADRAKQRRSETFDHLPSSIDQPPARPSFLGPCRTHNLWTHAFLRLGDTALHRHLDGRRGAATGSRDPGLSA